MEYYIAIVTEDTGFFSMENYGEQQKLPESSGARPDEHYLAVEIFPSLADVEEAQREGNYSDVVIIDCDLSYLQTLDHTDTPEFDHHLSAVLHDTYKQMSETLPGTVLLTCGQGDRDDDGLLTDYVPHLDKQDGVKAMLSQVSELIEKLEEQAQQPAATDDYDPALS